MTLKEMERELTSAVEQLRASVVRIRHPEIIRARGGRFETEAAGTGVVVDSRGYVVTNDHVVRDATELRATLDDGREMGGEVVGSDRATDLAIVRLDGRGLPAATLAPSEELKVGQFVIAIGNALGLPGGPSASLGVISALGRPLPGADYVLEGLIQTDAAINPGNSGGPLADLSGDVVGVNTAMIPYAQGVGFAIPSSTVHSVVDQILETGRVVRPWLGIQGIGLDATIARRFNVSEPTGVLLASVFDPSPATDAGLKPGDILVRVGKRSTRNLRELLAALAKLPIGGAVDFEYVRTGLTRTAVLRVAETPQALAAE
jgi:serine protease Do